MNTIKKIVLTGGPCAGKTTALVKVIEHFRVWATRSLPFLRFLPCSPSRA